jgi:hypothetical protein
MMEDHGALKRLMAARAFLPEARTQRRVIEVPILRLSMRSVMAF